MVASITESKPTLHYVPPNRRMQHETVLSKAASKRTNKIKPESDCSDKQEIEKTDELNKQIHGHRVWDLWAMEPSTGQTTCFYFQQIGYKGKEEREGKSKDIKRLKGCSSFKVCP